MKKFMSEDFLLNSRTAKKLYFEYAEKLPVIDWHCYLPPKEIETDKHYSNLTEAWIMTDHYKWRAMRMCGVDEKFITGGATDREKFDKWAEVLPRCIGSPLYHWAHLELSRIFGIQVPLSPKTATMIWETAGAMLQDDSFSTRGLMERFRVRSVFTTEDPTDSLVSHVRIRSDVKFRTKVLPSFQPDRVLDISDPLFPEYVKRLQSAAGIEICSFEDLKKALSSRMDFFDLLGCRASSQELAAFPFAVQKTGECAKIFNEAMEGRIPDELKSEKYRTCLLRFLAKEYYRRGWVMKLCIGALRNNNTKMYHRIGPGAGFDSVDDYAVAEKLSHFLDSLEMENCLPKTVMFTLNPKDYIVLGTMLGNFASELDGKLQFGMAPWFNDSAEGIAAQIKMLAGLCVFANFIGMITDSRSFLSYPRHEYFRRSLCNILGEWVENGEYPPDYDMLGRIVEGICYKNAAAFFGIEE